MRIEDYVHTIDLSNTDITKFKRRCVGCLVVTHDKKILLQKRGADWETYPGILATFGGGIENGETPLQALQRELNEELGAKVAANDAIFLGTLTEAMSNHNDLEYVYLWHDKQNTITGCYEGEAVAFDNLDAIKAQQNIGDDVRWLSLVTKDKLHG